MAADMGQPLTFAQHSTVTSLGSMGPSMASGQASMAGPGMSYAPSMPMSIAQASMVQPHQVMNHMLTNYMQMMHWSQVRSYMQASIQHAYAKRARQIVWWTNMMNPHIPAQHVGAISCHLC